MSGRRVAMIGLGLMGSRMSARLLDAGYQVVGYDPDAARLEELESRGGTARPSVSAAVEGCSVALLSLPNSDVSREVCTEIASAGVPPLTVYDTTTGRPVDAEEISAFLRDADITYCDSTVSGNSALAASGGLVVMVGGPEEAYRAGVPVFEVIGRSHHHVGPAGAGSRMKLIVNHLLAIHRMALAEGLVVAELAGMELNATLEVLQDSLAYSRAMDAWGERMIAGDHEKPDARLRQSLKDSVLIAEHGLGLGASMDLSLVVRAALEEGAEGGLADRDNSSVVEVVRRRAGIGRLE